MNQKETTLIWLLGLISTDGSVNKKTNDFAFRIFSIEPDWIEVICQALKKIGIETSVYYTPRKKGASTIRLKNPSKIALLFDSISDIEQYCNPRKARLIRKAIKYYKSSDYQKSPHGHRYSKEETKFLKENYLEMTNQELSQKLNRSIRAISVRLSKLNLTRRPRWTDQEKKFLKENYLTMKDKQLTMILNRSENSIHNKRVSMRFLRR